MAKELKIEGKYFVVFDNVSGADEVRFPAGGVIPKYSGNNVDFYQYQPTEIRLNDSTYDATAIIDNRTGSFFGSLADFKLFVSENTGFFFSQSIDEDVLIQQAINEIYATFGDVVSVGQKRKSLRKFGENQNVGTSACTIMDLAGSETEETYVNTNAITYVVSDDASDTMDITLIEGHTTDGTDWTFYKTDTPLTLNGQTPVALPQGLSRIGRARIESKANGNIYFYEGGTVTSGVPDDDTEVHMIITAGNTQTQKGATTISSEDYYIITNVTASLLEKASSWADLTIEIKPCGGGQEFYPICQNFGVSSSSSTFQLQKIPYIIVPKNHDVRIVGVANTSNIFVAGGMAGFLASIIN